MSGCTHAMTRTHRLRRVFAVSSALALLMSGAVGPSMGQDNASTTSPRLSIDEPTMNASQSYPACVAGFAAWSMVKISGKVNQVDDSGAWCAWQTTPRKSGSHAAPGHQGLISLRLSLYVPKVTRPPP